MDRGGGGPRLEGRSLRYTLVGHSTGAIIVNRLVDAFPDLEIRDIVYLASASTVDDFESSILPYLARNDDSYFYNITLDTVAESREVTPGFPVFAAPSGSLLEWLDVYFTSPPAHTGRVIGKWENAMASVHQIPPGLRDRVTYMKFPYGDDRYPQTHGGPNDLDLEKFHFWRREDWQVPDPMGGCPSRS